MLLTVIVVATDAAAAAATATADLTRLIAALAQCIVRYATDADVRAALAAAAPACPMRRLDSDEERAYWSARRANRRQHSQRPQERPPSAGASSRIHQQDAVGVQKPGDVATTTAPLADTAGSPVVCASEAATSTATARRRPASSKRRKRASAKRRRPNTHEIFDDNSGDEAGGPTQAESAQHRNSHSDNDGDNGGGGSTALVGALQPQQSANVEPDAVSVRSISVSRSKAVRQPRAGPTTRRSSMRLRSAAKAADG